MISMARTLGAPETVPAGKQAISASKQSTSSRKPAAQARNQMHHVRKALHGHELFDFYAAVFADAAKIVAAEVHEHDVLGALFFAGEHLLFEALVFGFVSAARQSAGDGAVKNVAALHFDEHFRGAAHDVHVVHVQIEKIRRRIQGAKLAINFERVGLDFGGKALADDHLKNVAGADVGFCFANGGQIFRLAKIGSNFQRPRFLCGSFARLLRGGGLLQATRGCVLFRARPRCISRAGFRGLR